MDTERRLIALPDGREITGCPVRAA